MHSQSHTVVPLFGIVRRQSNGLRTLAVNISDIDIVHGNVLGQIDQSSGVLIVSCSAKKTRVPFEIYNIIAIRARVGSRAANCQLSSKRRNRDLFSVGATVDENTLRIRGCRR